MGKLLSWFTVDGEFDGELYAVRIVTEMTTPNFIVAGTFRRPESLSAFFEFVQGFLAGRYDCDGGGGNRFGFSLAEHPRARPNHPSLYRKGRIVQVNAGEDDGIKIVQTTFLDEQDAEEARRIMSQWLQQLWGYQYTDPSMRTRAFAASGGDSVAVTHLSVPPPPGAPDPHALPPPGDGDDMEFDLVPNETK